MSFLQRLKRLNRTAASSKVPSSLAFCALIFVALLTALNSFAATPALEEVVVSATRVEQSAFDVAAAATSVAIDNTKLGVNLSDFTGSMAGIAARDRQNYAQDPQLSIRGFGARAQFGIVGVRLYVDGIPATMPDGQGQASHFDFDSASRIEVLRGPFSALYGNAAGGVVQVFTAAGDDQAEVRAGVQGGSADTSRYSVNARGKFSNIGYNLDYLHFHTDGWRDHSEAQRDLGNARFDFSPSKGNHLMIVMNRLSSPNAQDNGSLTAAQYHADPRQAAPSSLQFNTRKSLAQSQVGFTDEQQISDRQSLHVMLYSGKRNVMQVLATPTAAQSSSTSAGGIVDLHNRFSGGDAHWNFQWPLNTGSLSMVAGLAYDIMNSDRRGYNNFSGSTLGVVGELRRDETNQLYNFDQYLQGDVSWSERWSTQIGLRHNDVHFRSDDHFITAGNPDDSGSKRFAAWNPVAGALFRWSEQIHLYASYGRALDTPTFDNLAYRPDGAPGLNLALQAARTDTYELGAKWRTEMLSSRIAVFRSDTDNEIAVASSQGGRSTYRNVGRTRRTGFEAELQWEFSTRWHYQFAYTWLDARYRNAFDTCATNVCTAADVFIAKDNRIPGIARSTLFNSLRWGGNSGIYATLEANYLSKTFVNDTNTDYAAAFGLLNVNTGYTFDSKHWRGQFFVRADNLFDRRYVSAIVVNDANARYFQPGAGRSIYGGLNVTWK